MTTGKTSPLREALGPCVRALAAGKAKLLATEDDGRDAGSYEEWKQVANGLPPIAFEIAREARELVGRVGEIVGGRDDDFR